MPREMVKWSIDLPDWASWGEDDKGRLRVVLDPDVIYPKFLGIMKQVMPELDIDHPTQNMLQIATWLAQRRIKKLMYDSGYDFVRFYFPKSTGDRWKFVNFPRGDKINKRVFYRKLGLDKIRPESGPVRVDW